MNFHVWWTPDKYFAAICQSYDSSHLSQPMGSGLPTQIPLNTNPSTLKKDCFISS